MDECSGKKLLVQGNTNPRAPERAHGVSGTAASPRGGGSGWEWYEGSVGVRL